MNHKLVRRLLKSYPPRWRAEYGPEMEDLLAGRSMDVGDVRNILWSGLKERLRSPYDQFVLLSLLGAAIAFAVSVIFAGQLWAALAAPAVAVLREHGVRPPILITLGPYEGFEVIYVGIPLVMTVFFTFAWTLVLVAAFFARVEDARKRQCANRFVLCSGAVFVLTTLITFVAWQHGSVSKLLYWSPDFPNLPLLSIGHYFELFAYSTLGLTLLLQLPIVARFLSRLRAIR